MDNIYNIGFHFMNYIKYVLYEYNIYNMYIYSIVI